jgi:hypothetical protein
VATIDSLVTSGLKFNFMFIIPCIVNQITNSDSSMTTAGHKLFVYPKCREYS